MMMMRRVAIVFLLCAGCLAGCLERNERLTIRPDGSVFYEINYNSNTLSDIYAGDAVPTAGDGWLVEELSETDEDGTTTYTLHGVLIVDATTPLPGSYIDPGQAATSQALRFPTELIMEQRRDGMYYHFHRRYEPRRWAYVDIKRRELIDEPLKGIAGKPENELTDADRAALIRAFASFEIEKALVFAREAQLEVAPELPQDHWLALEGSMRGLLEEIAYDELIQIIGDDDEAARDQMLNAEVEKWEQELATRLERSAREGLQLGPGQVNRFLNVYELKREEFTISEDLGDDVFKITVEMPGTIIVSNAKSETDSEASWQFSGQQLRDNAIELMVTSVVR